MGADSNQTFGGVSLDTPFGLACRLRFGHLVTRLDFLSLEAYIYIDVCLVRLLVANPVATVELAAKNSQAARKVQEMYHSSSELGHPVAIPGRLHGREWDHDEGW